MWRRGGRREKWQPVLSAESEDTAVQLWMAVGGSAGHSGCWALDIEEGVVGEDFTGRRWQVEVETAANVRQGATDEKEQAKKAKQAEKDQQDEFTLAGVVDRLSTESGVCATDGGQAAGYTTARDLAGLSGRRMLQTVDRLIQQGILERCKVTTRTGNGAARQTDGLRRKSARDVP